MESSLFEQVRGRAAPNGRVLAVADSDDILADRFGDGLQPVSHEAPPRSGDVVLLPWTPATGPAESAQDDVLGEARLHAEEGAVVVLALGAPIGRVRLAQLVERLETAGLRHVDVIVPEDRPANLVLVATADAGQASAVSWTDALAGPAFASAEEIVERMRVQAGRAGSLPEDRAGIRQRHAQLTAQVRELEGELRRTQRRLAEVETSTKMRLGTALVDSVRDPGQRKRLPRELAGMWRNREREDRAAAVPEQARARVHSNGQAVMYRHEDAAPRLRTRPVVAAVVCDETAERLAAGASVVRLLPQHGEDILARYNPDLLFVETGAARLDSPWRFLADPAASDREVRLATLARAAQAYATPVVLWRNTGPHHTTFLRALAEYCDIVVDGSESGLEQPWSVGADLAFARPSLDRPIRSGIVLLGDVDPVHGAARAAALGLATSAAGEDLVRYSDPVSPFPGTGPALFRLDQAEALSRHAIGLANPFGARPGSAGAHPRTLDMLAAGLRVVSGPDDSLARILGEAGSAVVFDTDPVAAVERARQAGPVNPVEHRAVLRALYRQGTTTPALVGLLDMVDARQHVDVTRSVALSAGDEGVAAIVAAAAQTWRPEQIVLPTRCSDEALAKAAETDIPTIVSDHPARATSATWIAEQLQGDNDLLDLLILAEITGSDAVGLDNGAELRRRTTPSVSPRVRWEARA